jgi:hypothetical protein
LRIEPRQKDFCHDANAVHILLSAFFALAFSTFRTAFFRFSPRFSSKARAILRSESSVGLGCEDSRMLRVGCARPVFLARGLMEGPRDWRAFLSKRTISAHVAPPRFWNFWRAISLPSLRESLRVNLAPSFSPRRA